MFLSTHWRQICLSSCLVLFPFSVHSSDVSDHERAENYYQFNKELLQQGYSEIIDPFSGKMRLLYKDFVSTGQGGFDLMFTRIDDGVPFIDWKWEQRVNAIADATEALCSDGGDDSQDNPSIRLANGKKEVFYYRYKLNNRHNWGTFGNWSSECVDDKVAIYSPNGRKYETLDNGSKKITDKNGNYAIWSDNKITTNDGRVINLNYQNDKLQSITSGKRKTQYTYKTYRVQYHEGQGEWRSEYSTKLHKVIYASDQQWEYDYYTGNYYSTSDSRAFKKFKLYTVTHPNGGKVVAYIATIIHFPSLPVVQVVQKPNSFPTFPS